MVYFFGARIDLHPVAYTITQLEQMLLSDRAHVVITPNPEMLLHARRNAQFSNVLQNADYGVVDGAGLLWMLQLKGAHDVTRFTGVDLVHELARVCALHNKKICIVGGEISIMEKVKDILSKKFHCGGILALQGPKLTYNHGEYHEEAGEENTSHSTALTRERIRAFAPAVLLVGFGHGKQEMWLSHILPQLSSVRVAAGVGGAFDIISGKLPRAPLFFRRCGLEWLWRVILEPHRIHRIFRAVILFPLLALFQKIDKKI